MHSENEQRTEYGQDTSEILLESWLRSGSCAFHMYNQTTVEKQMLSLQPKEAVSVEGIQD